jgi:hypothetical protein
MTTHYEDYEDDSIDLDEAANEQDKRDYYEEIEADIRRDKLLEKEMFKVKENESWPL